MKIPLYLAITPEDINKAANLPSKIAWMSVRFDKSRDELTNLPAENFDSCILVLDDCEPYIRYNNDKICQQLKEHIQKKNYDGLLLDFQRPRDGHLYSLARQLEKELPIKVAVTPHYSTEQSIVFLPPLPPAMSIEHYLAAWSTHEIWLDMTTQITSLCITEEGIRECAEENKEFPFYSKELCTHYAMNANTEKITFSFLRTPEDCMALLDAAEAYNVRSAFSLFYEMEK